MAKTSEILSYLRLLLPDGVVTDGRLTTYEEMAIGIIAAGLARLLEDTRSLTIYVSTRKLLRALGIDDIPSFMYAYIRRTLNTIARVYGVGTYQANGRTYFILDARRLKALTKEEMAKEFTRIILEGDES